MLPFRRIFWLFLRRVKVVIQLAGRRRAVCLLQHGQSHALPTLPLARVEGEAWQFGGAAAGEGRPLRNVVLLRLAIILSIKAAPLRLEAPNRAVRANIAGRPEELAAFRAALVALEPRSRLLLGQLLDKNKAQDGVIWRVMAGNSYVQSQVSG